VQGDDQRLKLSRPQVLDLVYQEDHPDSVVSSGLADGHEQVCQVLRERAAVADAAECLDVETRGHCTIGAECEGEGLQDRGGSEHSIRPSGLRGDLQQNATHIGRHLGPEWAVLLDLPLNRGPFASLSFVAEYIEENGLADTAEPRDDH